ncbi:DUF6701 domain-containing protein [Cellvibrio sp. pealriver]|uniref:DUF6701 domain-containing protein n=1 Tax=Cellvibrio sp. pealriver TaxID=1622269 RepID=UPI0018CE6617|nr:DUF6701 domain-containing protein [Cellvibrio sp. pealriver]
MLIGFCCFANAATYNLTSGSYPPCNTSWSVSGTTYTCNGNGRVTLASGDILTANTTITISANNGFSLNNNTVGSSSNRINLTSTYGNVDASGTNTVFGNITSSSGNVTLVGTALTGTITTGGAINLTGGSVSGLVTSQNQTIITNGANLSGGARGHSGMNFTGGTLSGNFVMTSNNPLTMSAVTMTSGSISGSSNAVIQNGSQLGSASSPITITTNTDPIIIINSTVYGNLTAPNYSTVDLTNGGTVYGTCLPNSTPANACGPAPLPPTPMNCTDGTSSGITGYYYNNRTLTEPSTGTRSDAPIDFSWGGAAPGASGINADNFSVRWNGFIRATQTGAYRFQTESDDGVRLYINDTLIIDRWNDHSATTDTSTDINLVAGNTYKIRLEYYENGGDAVIRLRWRLPGSATYVAIPGGPLPTMGAGLYECTPAPKPPVSSCSTNLSAGITGNYFNNQTLTNPVTRTRLDGPINFDWGTGVPGPAGVGDNNFSVRWEGYIHVTQSGVHRFQTNSDDGVRLTVNGDLLIDQWNDHSVTTHTSAAVNLIAGNRYPIKLEYYENGGFAVAQLRWQTPGSASYVAIPSGVNASPITAPGLYECVTTPAGYLITHSATGITCAAESVTVTALNSSGVAYNPPAGTVVTMSTAPATGVWVGGTTFTFTGSESSFTKYLRQTTPGNLTIRAESATASATSPITFLDTALRIQHSASVIPIPTQIAGVEGNVGNSKNAIAKVISTNPKTGVCEAVVASRTLQMGIGFTCNNPTTCAGGQFLVNGAVIAPNNNGASVNYNNVNVTFNASGEAPMTLNYSDVGQVTLHGRLKIDALGNNPELTIFASSSPFVVKPNSFVVAAVQRTNGTPNPGGSNAPGIAAQFVAAGEQFKVFVASMNGATPAAVTPNFGREITPETQFLKIKTQSIVHPAGGVPTELTVSGSITAATPQGVFSYDDVRWNQVGSITIIPEYDNPATTTIPNDRDYLGGGVVSNFISTGTVGRFYPNHFTLANSTLTNSCTGFSYMQQPLNLSYSIEAKGVAGNTLTNYIPAYGTMPTISYVTENADAGVNLSRFSDGATHTWAAGVLPVNSAAATFSRSSPNQTPDGPYTNLQVGLQLTDSFDSRSLQGLNMNASTTGACSGAGCTAIRLGSALNMRYGRLRLDDAFGPETAPLPVNFSTEYWGGGFFVPNTDDSNCTKILRSAITYPAGSILTPANLQVSLGSGTTTGSYASITATEIVFSSGSAQHSFSAPTGNAQGQFNVDVDLTAYPWLRFDWNQDGNYSDTSLPTARFGFGSYRGHDRVIYWRERFN